MCWVSSEHLDGIWISCTRWTIEVPIYFELSVDHLVAGSDWSPQRGDCQPYFSALCCQCWNHQFFFFFIVSNPLSCGRHTSDCSKIFFKRARKPRNKTTRFKFTDIAEYVKKQQYFTLQHHRVMCQFIQASRTSPCFPPVLRQTPTYIDDKNKNYTYIHIYI